MSRRRKNPTNLTLTSSDGKKVRLRAFSGKIIVLNLWATWRVPCREEMPVLVEAEKVWKPEIVVFLGASVDDNKTKGTIPFMAEFNVTFPILTGATLSDLARLHLGDAVPDTAFVDSDGVIFARVRGEIRRAELDERLAWALGDRKAPLPQPEITHLK